MNQEKYIGMDVHAATISAAVRNAEGKLLMECVLETKVLIRALSQLTGRCVHRSTHSIMSLASRSHNSRSSALSQPSRSRKAISCSSGSAESCRSGRSGFCR